MAFTSGIARVLGGERHLAADGSGTPKQLPYQLMPRHHATRSSRRVRGSSGSPKRSESRMAIGRAPMVKMSRRMPPTPVAAPWNGSMKDGWLWLSILKARASSAAQVDDAGVLAGALQHVRALGRQPRRKTRECL